MTVKDHIDSSMSPDIVDTSLQELHTLELTKQEWIIIFNVLIRGEYRLSDAALVAPIVNKIQPLAAQLSNKDFKPKIEDAVVV